VSTPRNLAASGIAAALLLAGSPLDAVRLDLDRAIATALAGNPALLAVEETRRQVEGGIREARADAFPQLALVTSWGRSKSPALLNSPDFDDFLDQLPAGFEPSEQELNRAVIEVTQPLWTFGKVGAAIDLAEIVAGAAEAQIATARLDTALEAAEAYYALLAAREGLTTVESEREFRRGDLARVEDLLEIGEATELERLRAISALAEVEPEVARRQGEVAVAETRLRRALALPPGEPLELEAVARELPESEAIERMVAAALARRPEITDLVLQADVYEKRKVITHAEGLPQIELTGSFGREVREVDNFGDPLYEAWSLGVGLRWELFDGGRRRGQVAQFESQRQQLALALADLESRIRLEIDQAASELRTARARAGSAELAAAAAREAVRVARESYEQGVATQTDLLDAQSRAIAAQVLAVNAFYDTLIRSSRLARALGRQPNEAWDPVTENPKP